MSGSMEKGITDDVHTRAQRVLPAGGFGNYDASIFIQKGKGSHVWDNYGKRYIDFLIGSGPMLIGHCHDEVVDAVQHQVSLGQTFFTNNPQGLALAEQIQQDVACAEQVRFVSSGGEADMYAMRLARAHTGRKKIIKFEGGYHGMSGEALMSLFPKNDADYPRAYADSAGIPDEVGDHMLVVPYNDLAYVSALFEQHGDDIACVIAEPLQRIVPPQEGFLQGLRELTQKHNSVLIFDEVVTGYRLAYGGAQELYDVVPDLCTLGKIIGGGFPLAAVAGTTRIMNHFDRKIVGDAGFTLQIGTLSGNPVAAVAGQKTMEILRRGNSYQSLREKGRFVMSALREHLNKAGIAHQIVGDPVLFDVIFTDQTVSDYRGTISGDPGLTKQFNRAMRAQNILKSPSKFYISLSLTDDDLACTYTAIKNSVQDLRIP